MADASDSKSDAGNSVWVQVPSPAFCIESRLFNLLFLFSIFQMAIQNSTPQYTFGVVYYDKLT